jgi:cell wall-associated NlpC family hydrolase
MRAPYTSAMCLLSLCAMLPGCATRVPGVAATPPESHAIARLERGERAASIARQQIGVPYRYGGTSPSAGFDCSGLVHYSYAQAGLSVPRTSQEQFKAARKIALSDARPGDVVFFTDQQKLSHVGIYLGEHRFVHAPATGRTVSVARIDTPYYQEHLVAVGRLTPL